MAKILVADDDQDILIMVQALMELEGHQVACFNNSTDAIDRAKREHFDLIVTDANMPPFSGYDLIRTIRAIPTYDFVPIAMLTARKTRKDVERAVLVGAQDYIVKPINPTLLQTKVRDLLARSQAAQLAARFGELPVDFDATLILPLKIIAMTETGVVLDSEHRLNEGTRLKISSPLFDEIGIITPVLRVQTSSASNMAGSWHIRTSFQSLDERSVGKIRTYLQNGLTRKKFA